MAQPLYSYKPQKKGLGRRRRTPENGVTLERPKPLGYTIQNPPPASYDPVYDVEERSATRGLNAILEDATTSRVRNLNDYNLGVGQLGENLARGGKAVGQARQDTLEGFQKQQADLDTGYRRLAAQQGHTAVSRGVIGGAISQMAQKRGQNQKTDNTELEKRKVRSLTDLDDRFKTLNEDFGVDLGRLSLGFQRGNEDIATRVRRAQQDYLDLTQFDLPSLRGASSGYVGEPIRVYDEFKVQDKGRVVRKKRRKRG